MSDYDNILISFPYVYFNGKTIDIDEYIPMIKKMVIMLGILKII